MRYWYKQGRHQRLYRRLRDSLVPDVGEASTEAGEIVRAIGNVVYDVGNNGGCNFDSGRRSDLEAFIGFLKECKFEKANELHEQLAGLASDPPDDHCSSCQCYDYGGHERPPALDERLFDEAIDVLILEADKRSKRKKAA